MKLTLQSLFIVAASLTVWQGIGYLSSCNANAEVRVKESAGIAVDSIEVRFLNSNWDALHRSPLPAYAIWEENPSTHRVLHDPMFISKFLNLLNTELDSTTTQAFEDIRLVARLHSSDGSQQLFKYGFNCQMYWNDTSYFCSKEVLDLLFRQMSKIRDPDKTDSSLRLFSEHLSQLDQTIAILRKRVSVWDFMHGDEFAEFLDDFHNDDMTINKLYDMNGKVMGFEFIDPGDTMHVKIDRTFPDSLSIPVLLNQPDVRSARMIYVESRW